MEMSGPSHSLYSKVVVPSKVRVVPSARPVMSRVVPAGTVIPERTMLVQSALPAIAAAASVNVQPELALTAPRATVPLELLVEAPAAEPEEADAVPNAAEGTVEETANETADKTAVPVDAALATVPIKETTSALEVISSVVDHEPDFEYFPVPAATPVPKAPVPRGAVGNTPVDATTAALVAAAETALDEVLHLLPQWPWCPACGRATTAPAPKSRAERVLCATILT